VIALRSPIIVGTVVDSVCMTTSNKQKPASNVTRRSWVIYGTSKDDIPKIQRQMDVLFNGYSFYPEVDWIQYGYRPPDGYQVLGAWRHPKTRLFAFLLDNPRMITIEPAIQLLLYVAGAAVELTSLEPKLATLKTAFAIEDKKLITSSEIKDKLGKVDDAKHFGVLTGALSILTLIINGFSLYLRQLPPPQLGSPFLISIYSIFITLIHFSALFLLLLVAVIVAVFLIRYGYLMIKGM